VDSKTLTLGVTSKLLSNPIAAIYTPFSFILIYEVYLLVFYLPKSTSIYIGKQYEIITLIIIRRVFKDLSQLEFTPNWFNVKSDLNFTYDISATIILFFLIFVFYKLNEKKALKPKNESELSSELLKFIKIKNIVAMILIPIFLVLATYSLIHWVYESFFSINSLVDSITDVNNVFFADFFTILILVDVLLLLFSFLHIDKFNKIIRNSGFIISTILLKLSFSADGLLNVILIIVAVLFGVIILAIHNQFETLADT
jgi:hypothetical protein